jgi:hypothetical protein
LLITVGREKFAALKIGETAGSEQPFAVWADNAAGDTAPATSKAVHDLMCTPFSRDFHSGIPGLLPVYPPAAFDVRQGLMRLNWTWCKSLRTPETGWIHDFLVSIGG